MDLQHIIGLPVATAYTELVRDLTEVEAVAVVEEKPPLPLQRRAALRPQDEALIGRALKLRSTVDVPFWDAVMMTVLAEGADADTILRAALFHRSHRGTERWLERAEVLGGAFGELTARVASGKTVSLLSELRLRSAPPAPAHLPMLDFRCASHPPNLPAVVGVTRLLLPDGGLIVDSGQSYHAVGRRPVTADQLLDLLAKASLFGGIVDRAYVAHQLLERRCALRISRGGHHDVEPTVIAAF